MNRVAYDRDVAATHAQVQPLKQSPEAIRWLKKPHFFEASSRQVDNHQESKGWKPMLLLLPLPDPVRRREASFGKRGIAEKGLGR